MNILFFLRSATFAPCYTFITHHSSLITHSTFEAQQQEIPTLQRSNSLVCVVRHPGISPRPPLLWVSSSPLQKKNIEYCCTYFRNKEHTHKLGSNGRAGTASARGARAHPRERGTQPQPLQQRRTFTIRVSMDWVPLPPAINPLAAVRRTTADVMERANHVSLNGAAVEQLAKMWAMDGGAGGASIGWNESGWHYAEDAASGGSLTCQYVFVLGE